jgi:hypothetical protein
VPIVYAVRGLEKSGAWVDGFVVIYSASEQNKLIASSIIVAPVEEGKEIEP